MTARALPQSRSTVLKLADPPDEQPLLARASARLRQILCALHGHDNVVHFERGRMSLQCVSCGHESPGWTVSAPEVRCDKPLRFVTRASALRKTA